MSDPGSDLREKMRRSINEEFVRMEDDFDDARDKRKTIVDKLISEISNVKLTNENGEFKEDADTGIRLYATALKALSDVEKANTSAIVNKLKNQEQQLSNAAAAKERLEIVIRATRPGQFTEEVSEDKADAVLHELFDGDIKDFELKTNPMDYIEEE